uniref:Uncharacterized protein n=1 Tax=Rangifer tarandus platyrhynchus TaxID=3082113 RepID=A0ACB0EJ88_RANTA|nr:unnamed protein product [Rangifer tarandus platyrhynchus]
MGWAAKGPDPARGPGPRPPWGSAPRHWIQHEGAWRIRPLDTSFFPNFVAGGPGRREVAEGAPTVAHSRVLWGWRDEAFPAPLATQKGIASGSGWAPVSGVEAIASRGRARSAKIGPLALWTREEYSPPPVPSCQREPNCTIRHTIALKHTHTHPKVSKVSGSKPRPQASFLLSRLRRLEQEPTRLPNAGDSLVERRGNSLATRCDPPQATALHSRPSDSAGGSAPHFGRLTHSPKARPGTERLGGGRLAGAGGAGLRLGSSGFTNHISELCAGSEQPVA